MRTNDLNVNTYQETSMADSELVTIPRAELERLQKLEAELPSIIVKAKEEESKDALNRLHQRDKENPELARQRATNRYKLKKDEINAKRREAYKQKKMGSSSPENKNPGPC